jgi:tetratricopeptide (TPR) repeat protein
MAQLFTVQIDGKGLQGSGVLVKRDGNRYTVLTAWNVLSGLRPGETLTILTPDEQSHSLEPGSIKRLGEVDLAVLTFYSTKSYELSSIGHSTSVSAGTTIYVSGFPLPTSAVPKRILRFLKGDVIANSTPALPNGYQLIYSIPTLPGMSGGAVLNSQGKLVGIHARAEREDQVNERTGKYMPTGTNLAVPSAYYSQWASGSSMEATLRHTVTDDDYLAQARELRHKKGKEQEVIRLANQALGIMSTAQGYVYLADAKYDLGDKKGAIADYDKALAINPRESDAYIGRGLAKEKTGDPSGAIDDYNQALAINPKDYLHLIYFNRGIARDKLGDFQGALVDCSQALSINPKFSVAYECLGKARHELGDNRGAIEEYTKALTIKPKEVLLYFNRGVVKQDLGDKQGAITDYSKALLINPQHAYSYFNRGVVKHGLGDKQGAVDDFDKALAINPQDARFYYNRGFVKHDLFGCSQGVISDYSKALNLDSKHSMGYINRATCLKEAGNLRMACMDWRAAASLGEAFAAERVRKYCQ